MVELGMNGIESVNTLNIEALNLIKENSRVNLENIIETKKDIWEAGSFIVQNGEEFEMAGWGTVERVIDITNNLLVATFGIVDHKKYTFSGVMKGEIKKIENSYIHALVECVVLDNKSRIRHYGNVKTVLLTENGNGFGLLSLDKSLLIPNNPQKESELIKSVVGIINGTKN